MSPLRTVIVIGDSLACSRLEDKIGLQQTYAYRMQQALQSTHYIVNWAVSENNSRRVTRPSFVNSHIATSGAAYAVVQLGIVDCAPRLMSRWERLIGGFMARVPGLRAVNAFYVLSKARYRKFFTKWWPKTIVPLEEFSNNFRALVAVLAALPSLRHVFLINIAAPGDKLVSRSYGINRNVNAYNDVLNLVANTSKRVTIVDLYAVTLEHPEWVSPLDGYHICDKAHAWIADQIVSLIHEIESA